MRGTVMLSVLADERALPPFVTLKRNCILNKNLLT
jgi:hypothetical protein